MQDGKLNPNSYLPLALIKSIEDNHKIIKYWEIGCGGGTDSSSYVVLRTSAELDAFWQNLITKVKLDKPDVDFSKTFYFL